MTAARHHAKTGRKKVDVDQRKAEVEALLTALAEWEAEQDKAYIAKVLAMFDGYSETNAKLIAMGDPQATDVDSRKAWQERGRTQVGNWEDQVIRIIRPAGIHSVPDPKNEGKFIEVVGYYYVWRGLYDVRYTVDSDPDVIAQWHASHPGGKW